MKNYKTTIAGFAVGLLNLLANGANVKQAVFSASLLALGVMAKDYDLHGGSRSIDPTITLKAIKEEKEKN